MKRQQNKENTRRLLIEAAMSLFKEQDYNKTTVQEIVKLAGVTKPTFFAHFKSKEEILYRYDLNNIQVFRDTVGKAITDTEHLLDILKKRIVTMAVELHTTTVFTKNALHLLTISDNYKEMMTDIFRYFRQSTQEIIEFGQKNGVIKKDSSSESISRDIINIYCGALVSSVIFNGSESLESLLEGTLSNYFRTLTISE